MVKKLKVYNKDNEIVGEEIVNKKGSTKVVINGLKPNTTYPKGTFKVAHDVNGIASELIDVPEFKTKASISISKSLGHKP